MAILTRIISNGQVNGEVKVPQAASLLHRYLICSALSGRAGDAEYVNGSRSIEVTKRCLDVLGLGQETVSDENFIYRLECEESDSTYKFLLPIASACGKTCMYSLKGNLVFTSMDQFYKILRTHGVRRDEIRPDLVKVSGRLTAGTYIFPGVTDGQALSGLLMALPLLKEKSTVMVEKRPQSELYVDMTVSIMREAGIEIEALKDQNGLARVFRIPGSQKYDLASELHSEGDWEIASYWLTGAAISGGSVTCTNMNPESLQGNRRILKILELFGVDVSVKQHLLPDCMQSGEDVFWSDVTVNGGHIKGTNIDAGDIPDLLPQVVLLASMACGISIIKNAASIRMSQDRVRSIISAMTEIGAEITEITDGLLISGSNGESLRGGRVATQGDYRIAMMASIASSVCRQGVILEHSDAAERAYPEFFDELDRLKQNN